MTSALVAWLGILVLTSGAVTLARARRWSPDQDDPSGLRTRHLGARLALLPVVGLLPALAGAGAVLLARGPS